MNLLKSTEFIDSPSHILKGHSVSETQPVTIPSDPVTEISSPGWKMIQFSKCCVLFVDEMTKYRNSVILSSIHHHQRPWESTRTFTLFNLFDSTFLSFLSGQNIFPTTFICFLTLASQNNFYTHIKQKLLIFRRQEDTRFITSIWKLFCKLRQKEISSSSKL
jgi:hypothetical protein